LPRGHHTSDPVLANLDSHLQALVAAKRARRAPTADGAAQAAALGAVRAVLPVAGYGTDVTTSEGDAAHHGPAARALGFNGPGVTVGVISDSINKQPPGIRVRHDHGQRQQR
jgi:hypothetical protein